MTSDRKRRRRATVREAVDRMIPVVYPVKKNRPVYVTRGEHKGFYRHPPNRHLNYNYYYTPAKELGFLAEVVVGLWANPREFASRAGIDVNSPAVYAAITDWVGFRGPVPRRGISEQHITSLEVLAGKRQPAGPNYRRLLAKKGVTP